MADEITFYSDQSGARVTDRNVVLNRATFSTANITSVKAVSVTPSRVVSIFCVAVGGILVLGGIANQTWASAGFGALTAAVGYYSYSKAKPVWHLKISSASGESTPLRSPDQLRIISIAQAIDKAIASRA